MNKKQKNSLVFASPSIRKMARELMIDITQIIGSGHNGRILASDLTKDSSISHNDDDKNYGVQDKNIEVTHDAQNQTTDHFGIIVTAPIGRIKKIAGINITNNWQQIPHVTQFDEANIDELEQFRLSLNHEYKDYKNYKHYQNNGIKITLLAFLIKISAHALMKFPQLNATLQSDNIILKKYYNIGFAVDTPNGLLVPVIKNVDSLGLLDISIQIAELANLAKAGKLNHKDMMGGTFTISSLGGIGGTMFTPIINGQESAILGISKSQIKPIWQDDKFIPQLTLPLSLSYDHRIIDGVLAAKFTTYFCSLLSNIKKLIL